MPGCRGGGNTHAGLISPPPEPLNGACRAGLGLALSLSVTGAPRGASTWQRRHFAAPCSRGKGLLCTLCSPGGGSQRCRKSFGQTRHPRWLSGCALSGSDRVIPKPSLSGGWILPEHCSLLPAHGLLPPVDTQGDGESPARAGGGTRLVQHLGTHTPQSRWPHLLHHGQELEATTTRHAGPGGSSPGSEPLSLAVRSMSPPESPRHAGLSHEAGREAPSHPPLLPARPHTGVRAGRAALARRGDGGCMAVAAEAEAGARVTKSQGSWAQRGQLLLGFRCPRRRRGRTGTGGHRPAPGSTGPRGRRATYRRGGGAARGPRPGRLWLGVLGEAGVVSLLPPSRRGPSAKGRATRKRLRTKPRWG